MKNLNSKSADFIKNIARELLFCEKGERIPTTTYLANKFSVGLGTVEKSLSVLKEGGIITLQPRGQMGTYLLEKKTAELWNIADYGPLVGILPLPNTREYEGLATGITEVFAQAGIMLSLTFKNGSKERVKSLLSQRCDFVVLSSDAAETVLNQHKELELAHTLSSYTYYSELVVMRRKQLDKDRAAWRVGVDQTSHDHIALTGQQFSANEKIDVHYVNIPYFIANGKIDAAVWHNKSLIPLDMIDFIDIEPIQDLVSPKASAAAIVTHKDKPHVSFAFRELCETSRIEQIHQEVIARKRIPTY